MQSCTKTLRDSNLILWIQSYYFLTNFDFALEPAQTDSRGISKNRAAFIFPENSGNKGTAIRILTDTYSALDGSVFQVNKAYSSILVKIVESILESSL